MRLRLDLEGIIMELEIRNYKREPCDDGYSAWCNTDYSFRSEPWLNYCKTGDEIFLSSEIANFMIELDALLSDRLEEPEEFTFAEPDFSFYLKPKKILQGGSSAIYAPQGDKEIDIDMELRISFWNDGLTANYLSVTFDREDIECFFIYLKLVTGEITTDHPRVIHLMKKGILQEKEIFL